ncbi:hypothetical protein CRG98_025002 [Punica granatum]|uniref:Photolyase/cryptochrome alpha/beta domain-containing protein n=1 Tax=Punica granatum TaxID=22663 RepID=A0A2I0JE15_PUNGR|nr:hypothetical protein CRG98_025002 [Punica granatum]
MAFLAFPRFLPIPSSGSCSLTPRTSTKCSRLSVSACAGSKREKDGVAILWFKHDLRLDDHPGLVAAAQYRSIVPLYIFDHRLLSRYSDEMLELLLFALKDLKDSLIEQGSDLMIRIGSAEKVLPELAKEAKASSIFLEEEVEYHVQKLVDVVKESLVSDSSLERRLSTVLWRTPFYDIQTLHDLPESYDDFKKLQTPLASPPSIAELPSVKLDLDWGELPKYDYLEGIMNASPSKLNGSWTFMKQTSAETILRERLSKSDEKNKVGFLSSYSERKKLKNSFFVTKNGNTVGGGAGAVLNALHAYLRYLEGTARDNWQELHDKIRVAESQEGSSFYTLFGSALCLGIISRRRVYSEAINYEKERNAGFISPFGYSSATVAAAVNSVSSMEWYWIMALRSQRNNKGMYSIRIWRWNNFLIQYTTVGDQGPPVLMVHGFGAFLEHYRDNICNVANSGNRVWAITLLGFGRSEKPNVVYTELLWAELLRDFIIEVVGEPVHVVGNSIGGYVAAILAGLWPTLLKSLILINSAGNMIPVGSYIPLSKERQTSSATWLGARFLLYYLRSTLRNIVRNCYPAKPERADEWLIGEMLRASHDPGVSVVLESIFSFNLSIPLNYILQGLYERVLVIQGMKDPLSDSKTKLAMLREHCPGIMIRKLDAGHCPHDECPEEVNPIVCDWIMLIESRSLPVESCF